jgi:hypothetical protein
MKIKIKEFTRQPNFLSHMILECVGSSKVAMDTVCDIEDRDENTEVEIEFKFNGVELDVRKFTRMLEDSYNEETKKAAKPSALEMFEKYKHDFKSKNSTAAKLSKVQAQFDKLKNQMINIQNSINGINL